MCAFKSQMPLHTRQGVQLVQSSERMRIRVAGTFGTNDAGQILAEFGVIATAAYISSVRRRAFTRNQIGKKCRYMHP